MKVITFGDRGQVAVRTELGLPQSSIGDGRAVLETSHHFGGLAGPRRAGPGPRGAPRCRPGQSAGAGRARWLCLHER